MRDRDLYARILGLPEPWKVTEVTLALEADEVRVKVEYASREKLPCPECRVPCAGYDTRPRRWRHLDTCQLRTILEAEVPRVKCREHGVKQVVVPWADPRSGFTALFECVVIDWLKEAPIDAVGELLRLSWDEVDGIMERAVRRGLARREKMAPKRIAIDETSFQKRHEYVTVVTDVDSGTVLHVADDRRTESLEAFYGELGAEQRASIEAVAMDMWKPYINATRTHVPDADRKICFDRFHVARLIGEAVDTVRKREHRELRSRGDETLKGTKYDWLTRPEAMSEDRRDRFASLRDSALRTSRAWAIKETAARLWDYCVRFWAEKAWKKWIGWAQRSRLEPMRKTARTIRDHLRGIINAIVKRVTNAVAESINSGIQRVKRMACGFRNRARFRRAIYFHLGGLDLYPALPDPTHTDS